jgi:hypothetical protein
MIDKTPTDLETKSDAPLKFCQIRTSKIAVSVQTVACSA